jgi:acyl-CoA synthetase (AMP-forming)/AMP-acid ligase II
MVSHTNVIANCLQYTTFDSVAHKKLGVDTQVVLGLLPFSHIYALVVVTQACTSRGDSIIVLPAFDLQTYLAATQRFKIDAHFVVPPIVVQLIRNQEKCNQYDLSCIRVMITAAAPLGPEVADLFQEMLPSVKIGQAYGAFSSVRVPLKRSMSNPRYM